MQYFFDFIKDVLEINPEWEFEDRGHYYNAELPGRMVGVIYKGKFFPPKSWVMIYTNGRYNDFLYEDGHIDIPRKYASTFRKIIKRKVKQQILKRSRRKKEAVKQWFEEQTGQKIL